MHETRKCWHPTLTTGYWQTISFIQLIIVVHKIGRNLPKIANDLKCPVLLRRALQLASLSASVVILVKTGNNRLGRTLTRQIRYCYFCASREHNAIRLKFFRAVFGLSISYFDWKFACVTISGHTKITHTSLNSSLLNLCGTNYNSSKKAPPLPEFEKANAHCNYVMLKLYV